jgi:hypothetical protein
VERPQDRLRRLLLLIFVLGALGVGAELVLLDHTESTWQFVPLVLLPIGLLWCGAVLLRPTSQTVFGLRATMVAFVFASLIGLVQHYRGNVEFELEMYPSMKGLELVWEALTGATPALAPGAMALLGLIGLAACFDHPSLRTRGDSP